MTYTPQPASMLRTASCRWLSTSGILFLLLFTSCRNYRNEVLEISDQLLKKEHYDLVSVDTLTVPYAIDAAEAASQAYDVVIENAESSISVTHSVIDTISGSPYIQITYRTNHTPSGSYPVRVTVKNKRGAFAQLIATVQVTNYVELLRLDSTFVEAIDTIAYYPFNDPDDGIGYSYYPITARKKSGGAPDQFIFSNLGYIRNYGAIDDVTVIVDSLTGELTAVRQLAGGVYDYSGHGRLFRYPGYQKLKGYFSYEYYTYSGTHYQGRLSF